MIEDRATLCRRLANDRYERELNTWVAKLPSGPDSGGYVSDLEAAIERLTKTLATMRVRYPLTAKTEGGASMMPAHKGERPAATGRDAETNNAISNKFTAQARCGARAEQQRILMGALQRRPHHMLVEGQDHGN